jgi:hypothetical protein
MVAILILKLKSIHQIVTPEAEKPKGLKKATFKSPEKFKCVRGETAQTATILELLMSKGVNLDALRSDPKPIAGDDNVMDINDFLRKFKLNSSTSAAACKDNA